MVCIAWFFSILGLIPLCKCQEDFPVAQKWVSDAKFQIILSPGYVHTVTAALHSSFKHLVVLKIKIMSHHSRWWKAGRLITHRDTRTPGVMCGTWRWSQNRDYAGKSGERWPEWLSLSFFHRTGMNSKSLSGCVLTLTAVIWAGPGDSSAATSTPWGPISLPLLPFSAFAACFSPAA